MTSDLCKVKGEEWVEILSSIFMKSGRGGQVIVVSWCLVTNKKR